MVPFLDKYSSITIGLTLMLIGIMGLVESLTEHPEEVQIAQEPPPLAVDTVSPGKPTLNTSVSIDSYTCGVETECIQLLVQSLSWQATQHQLLPLEASRPTDSMRGR